MNPTTFTFSQIAEILTAGKIPCTFKEYRYENGDTRFSIEFGFNWPEELVDQVDAAFAKAGFRVPSNVGLCADSCGPNLIAKRSIAGGPQRYSGHRWG